MSLQVTFVWFVFGRGSQVADGLTLRFDCTKYATDARLKIYLSF